MSNSQGSQNIRIVGGQWNNEGNWAIGNLVGGNVLANLSPEVNVAETAKEIQLLLQKLEQTYPTNTPTEKMVVVEEAIKAIEHSPLKKRLIDTIKLIGVEEFKKLADHRLVNILVAALEG
ncbi:MULTISPECIES: hypothetical protein [Aerosakkonema]|uniref:hypothetical protein n=1 Tax=Aerosakkonema TaxID=1246629 RepID=UPI0035B92249